jgi:hypothetical protein
MMNNAELIALRSRLISAYANSHTIGAAEAYVKMLEAEVELANFNSRRGSVKHLLALVEAVLEARKKFRTKAAQPVKPIRGRAEIALSIDEAAFAPSAVERAAPIETAPDYKSKKKGKSKGHRSSHSKKQPDLNE